MRRILRLGLPVLLTAVTAGCNDRIPTLSGEGPFPVGGRGTTIEHVLQAEDFLLDGNVYRGTTGVEDVRGLVLARNYGGALNSHVLVTFGEFPDSVSVDDETYRDIIFLDGEVIASVPDTLITSHSSLTFELWTVAQPWDTTAVSWENAVDLPGNTVPWTEPGGTRGDLVATTTWSRADTAAVGDSLFWTVPATVMSRLAEDELQGLMITLADENSRVTISNLQLRTDILPSLEVDTIVNRSVPAGRQSFIFTPEAPVPDDVLSVGGLSSDRTILRIALPTTLPGCEGPQMCAPIPLSEVSLDRVDLVLDPVPVASGFGPVGPLDVALRSVHELELGERAVLGDSITQARVTEEGNAPVRFFLTRLFDVAAAENETELGVALLVEPEASSFGYAWFERNPRLRFIYTLPETLELP